MDRGRRRAGPGRLRGHLEPRRGAGFPRRDPARSRGPGAARRRRAALPAVRLAGARTCRRSGPTRTSRCTWSAAAGAGPGGPPLAVLPAAGPEEPPRREPAGWKKPPCARPARAPDPAELEALLEQLALRRLRTKTALQRRRITELGPGRAGAAALARALGQPRNADLLERALLAAADVRAAPAAAAIETAIGAESTRGGWRRGRGAADRPAGRPRPWPRCWENGGRALSGRKQSRRGSRSAAAPAPASCCCPA